MYYDVKSANRGDESIRKGLGEERGYMGKGVRGDVGRGSTTGVYRRI